MSDVELLPCPFCGGPANTSRDTAGDWEAYCNTENSCTADVGRRFPTQAQAIAAWNRRPSAGAEPEVEE